MALKEGEFKESFKGTWRKRQGTVNRSGVRGLAACYMVHPIFSY